MLHLTCLCIVTVFVVAEAAKNYCGPDEYFDAVDNKCVPCSKICDTPNEFCSVNCPRYNLKTSTNEPFRSGDRKFNVESRRRFTRETSPAAWASREVRQEEALASPGQQTHFTLIVVLLAVVLLLLVVLVCVAIGFVRQRQERCAAQRSLLSIGESGDSVPYVLTAAPSTKIRDDSSGSVGRSKPNSHNYESLLTSTDEADGQDCYVMLKAPPSMLRQLQMQKPTNISSVTVDSAAT